LSLHELDFLRQESTLQRKSFLYNWLSYFRKCTATHLLGVQQHLLRHAVASKTSTSAKFYDIIGHHGKRISIGNTHTAKGSPCSAWLVTSRLG
jgi:hypothetical protein